MDEPTETRSIAVPGLAMLDALRPPPGWVTDIALGTTYSLELPVALAAMVSLSGTARETSEYGLHSAVRALQTLSKRVRILAQQGRIDAPAKRHKLVHLLDQIVRPIVFDERERSFHPKTWLVRWKNERDDALPGRWALVVGSRNLTSSQDWDLGVTLVGEEGAQGAKLPRLADYVSWLLTTAAITDFGGPVWDRLDAVRWRGPVPEIGFDFHGDTELAWKDAALTRIARDGARRVLVLSPFVDGRGLREAERTLTITRSMGEPTRRFVLGRPDLERIVRARSAADVLGKIAELRCLSASQHGLNGPRDGGEASTDDDVASAVDFNLHAKSVVVWHGKNDVSLLVGSANLTARGWTGRNAEAWVKLRGRTDVAESLWQWSRIASSFEPSQVQPLTPEEETRLALEDAVDALRSRIAVTPLTLDDSAMRGVLSAETPLGPSTVDAGGRVIHAALSAARLGTSGARVVWPEGASQIELGSCAQGERSALVAFHLRVSCGNDAVENTWVQSVTVTPAIAEDRDAEAIADALGPRQFMAYLNGLLDPGRDEGDGDPNETPADGASGAGPHTEQGYDLSLELILRAFARRDGARVAQLHDQLARAIGTYRKASHAANDASLQALFEAWSAIEQGLVRR